MKNKRWPRNHPKLKDGVFSRRISPATGPFLNNSVSVWLVPGPIIYWFCSRSHCSGTALRQLVLRCCHRPVPFPHLPPFCISLKGVHLLMIGWLSHETSLPVRGNAFCSALFHKHITRFSEFLCLWSDTAAFRHTFIGMFPVAWPPCADHPVLTTRRLASGTSTTAPPPTSPVFVSVTNLIVGIPKDENALTRGGGQRVRFLKLAVKVAPCQTNMDQ